MNKFFKTPLMAWALALIAMAILPASWAQTETPLPPETPKVAPAEPAAPEAEPAAVVESDEAGEADKKSEALADEKAATEKSEPELRELGTTTEVTVEKSEKKARRVRSSNDGPPLGNHHVTAGSTRQEVVSIMGSSTVDGIVKGDAVSIMGSTTINGSCSDAVSIMGNTTVNGTVNDQVVTVMGDVVLGPKAVVHDIVVVMGRVIREDGAQVLGDVQEVTPFGHFGGSADFAWLHAWISKCLMWGRPLWIGENLGWVWAIVGAFTIFYMLLALIFPKGVVRSAEALEKRPGATLLTTFLSIVLVPVAFVLLAITGVGVVLIPFLIAALFFGSLFGMATVLAWFGRRVLGPDGLPLVAVLVGSVIVSLLYMIPILGFVLWKLFGILGLGMVVQALIIASNRDKPVAAASASGFTAPVPPIAPMPAQSTGFTGATTAAATPVNPVVSGDVPPVTPAVPPVASQAADVPPVYNSFTPPPRDPRTHAPILPVISAATLPRVGFWLRIGASALDAVLVGVFCGFLDSIFHGFGGSFLFWYALYCVVMWATKGTTIGGIVCSVKVVRLDDRPIDWGVAAVRALGGFLSLFAAGLGFIWVAFDDDKQSWHDKIAGTTIVRVPKGTSLL